MTLAILAPALSRPHNVKPFVDSVKASTPTPYRILFICDPGDVPEQDAIALADCQMISPGGGYASKIRAGIDATDEPLLFLAADDLRFRHGWFEAATAQLTGDIQVVGVNDGLRRPHRPNHATHFLMTRAYAKLPTADGRPGPLSTAYHHSFTDDELIATATHRGVYRYAEQARVDHWHWMNGRADDDDVYRLGRAQFRQDRKTFLIRSRLWT